MFYVYRVQTQKTQGWDKTGTDTAGQFGILGDKTGTLTGKKRA